MALRRLAACLLAAPLAAPALVAGPWADATLSAELRAQKLVENLTLSEKLGFLHGFQTPYVGAIAGVPRLGIPQVNMNDGPQGFRQDEFEGSSTAWPSGLAMAASWDVDAMYEWGAGMAKEFFDKGANVFLGPGVNVARVPLNGRNFEYLSGEDPFLGYTLVQPTIQGIQSQHVVANAKHWVLNNQETNRQAVSAEVDERTRFEIYYPPFEGAIEAGVGSFMCSYNKINGVWSCEDPVTLGDLKQHLGFRGYVMSDWGACHSISLAAGLDNEQLGKGMRWHTPELLASALDAGAITQSMVDSAVVRILWSMFSVGALDLPASAWDPAKINNNVTSEASAAKARKLSAVSTVLLKNEGSVLPLRQGPGTIAVLGLADTRAITHGGGSGAVVPPSVSTPLDGIRVAAGAQAIVEFDDGVDVAGAAALAARADVAIVFAGTFAEEGNDRQSLSLDAGLPLDAPSGLAIHNQNALISAVAAANPKTVVVLSVPGAILMPWSRDVAAILTNFLPGQQAGNAIADVLFGLVNPSGKLPLTFPNAENEVGFDTAQYPGLGSIAPAPDYVFYKEKLLVGYRFYEAHNISFSTGFPFGHGLSYSTFEVSDLSTATMSIGVDVSFSIQNTGNVPGAEVPQLYLTFPASAGEPPRQLKGFKKTDLLQPGQSQSVLLRLRLRDLSIWDEVWHQWRVVPGLFTASVGFSSRDLRLSASFTSPAPEAIYA